MASSTLTSQDWRERAGVTFTPTNRPVVGYDGMVASTHKLASAAGAEVMAAGGNAIDGVVATLFTLTVVEPMMVGIYGAGFFNIRLADGTRIAIDNYAQAPLQASMDMFEAVSDDWPNYMRARGDLNQTGVLSSGVPGSLLAWCSAVSDYGALSLPEVIGPAIRLAENGYRVSARHRRLVEEHAELLMQFSSTAAIFLPGGELPKVGDLVVQRDFAATLKRIAIEGSDYLYGGELGREIVSYSRSNGGVLSMDDLLGYRIRRSDPIMGNYRGCEITGPQPASAGGLHLIELLNILALRDIRGMGFGRTASLHLMAEALQLVFASRNLYLSDPEFKEIPFDRLLSEFHAREQMSRILPNAVMPDLPAPNVVESAHTVHATAADGDGNVVAATQTLNNGWGSKVVVPGTGVLLDDTMANFDPHPNQPNSVEPGKRVASSMSPIIAYRNGRPIFALGSVGGMRIWPSAAQTIVNIIDHGMTPQEAIEAPRMWTQGQEVELEDDFGTKTADALGKVGHDVVMSQHVGGGMNMIEFCDDSSMVGATCWRSDSGAAAVSRGVAREGVGFSSAATKRN